MVKHLHLILLFLLTIVGGQKAKAQTYDYLVFEQNGIYYFVQDDNVQIIEGAIGAYYIEHNGDLSGWDYNVEHEVLPAYRGNVTVPAEVTYQGKTYPITSVYGFSNNKYLTSLIVKAPLTYLSLYNVPELKSLTLNNTEQMTSVSLSQTGLSTFHVPATVTYASFDNNNSMKSVTVSSGNSTYTSVNGMLANKPEGNYWYVRYVPEGIEGTLVLPEGITNCVSIANCKKVTEVVIPSTFQVYAINELLNGTEGIKVTIGNPDANIAVVDDLITNRAKDSVIYILPSQAETLTIPEGIRYADFSNLASFYYEWVYDETTGQSYQDYNTVVLQGSRPHVKTINLPSTYEVNPNSYNPNYYDGLTYYINQAYELQTMNVAVGNP